jgi:hypothetical protein
MTTFGQLSLSVGLGTLSLQLVCFVILNIVDNFENSYRCTAWLNISFSNDVRTASIMLSCDQPRSVLHECCANPRSNRFLNPELVHFGLAQTLWFKLKIWLLSMRCIACAFGKHGYTNVHSHETPYPYLTSLVWWRCYPIVKGAATEPRVSCVLQPPDYH